MPLAHSSLARRAPTALLLALVSVAGCKSDPNKLTAEQEKALVERYTETAQEYLRMGELDRAEGQCLKALEHDPDNERCKLIRGWTLQKRGKTEDILVSERIFREILDGGDYRAVLGLAECLERKGVLFDEAAREIESGQRVSDAADPKARVDQLRRERDRAWSESIQRYEDTLEKHADDVDALNGAMRVCALLSRLEASLGYAARLVDTIRPTRDFWEKQVVRPEITAEDERLFRQRARHLRGLELVTQVHASSVLHELGRDQEAIQHLDEAIALDSERAELFSRRAELKKSLGAPDQAIADIDQFLRLSRLEYEHPDVQRAWRLRKECEDAVRKAQASSAGAR